MMWRKCTGCNQPKMTTCWARYHQDVCDQCVIDNRTRERRDRARQKREERQEKVEANLSRRERQNREREEAIRILCNRMYHKRWYSRSQLVRLTGNPPHTSPERDALSL